MVTSKCMVLTLADGTSLEFPYNNGSNLPLMLPDHQVHIGATRIDRNFLRSAECLSTFLSVTHKTNQNINASQKELLLWHWKLGHAGFGWIQKLAARQCNPKEGQEEPILSTKQPTVSSCQAPLCTACQMAKQNRRGTGVSVKPDKEMAIRKGNIQPGEMVSIDQYISSIPGRLPNTRGKESKKEKFIGGTLFVDHASGYIHLRNQQSLRVGDTLKSKHSFEHFSKAHGIKIQSYHADNVPFAAPEFVADLELKQQHITYSGTGAHHQNGVAEQAIQTVTRWARAMLLHAVLHWPDQADLSLWPFALEHAIYLWNNMPSRETLMAPIEIFTCTKLPSYDHLQQSHVWGCPVYVLDPKLQDGKKLPKWLPRTQ